MGRSSLSVLKTCCHSLLGDSLIRGFILTTIMLLGVGLEQSLVLPAPSDSMMAWFLVGNLAGLVVGNLIWLDLYPKRLLPLYAWQLAGLVVAAASWRTGEWLFFMQGMVLGTLLIHLLCLARGLDFHSLAKRIGLGICMGNLLLMLLKYMPKPLGLAWLAVALAGWRIKRPDPDFSASHSRWKNIKTISWFWAFFLCFYCLGGLYFSFLAKSAPKENQLAFGIVMLAAYLIGLILVVVLSRYHIRVFPFLATTIMGLSLILQLQVRPFPLAPLSLMDLSFGIMDCFSVAFIFAFSASIFQGSIGLAIFPLSLIVGLLANNRCSGNPSMVCIWALGLLFVGLIPLYYSTTTIEKIKRRKKRDILALPPSIKENVFSESEGNEMTEPDPLSSPPVLKHEEQGNEHVAAISEKLALSPREKQVFYGLVRGGKLKEIARELGLATGTVKTLSSRIYEKAGVRNKKELLEKIEAWNHSYQDEIQTRKQD